MRLSRWHNKALLSDKNFPLRSKFAAERGVSIKNTEEVQSSGRDLQWNTVQDAA